MPKTVDSRMPRYDQLMMPIFTALKKLGGSGNNDEILDQIIADLNLPDEVVDIPHKENSNLSELQYRLTWAKTYLNKCGVLENSARSIWSIHPDFVNVDELDVPDIVATVRRDGKNRRKQLAENSAESPEDNSPENDAAEFPEEIKPWRMRLADILKNMDAYGFERLSQRLLRECGFAHVEVTKKSGDGGIDGTGKWKINGIFSFNVAFQCKRYRDLVGAGAIRDFRGSLTTDIEKGIFITTGTFSKAARDEAAQSGKQQIDLIDGEEFIDKIAEYGIGVKEVKSYEIDEEFFEKI